MKRRTTRPRFGDLGTKLVRYTGKMPAVLGPFVTAKIYRFSEGKNPREVDVRDLTLLAKAAGRENLVDLSKKPTRARKIKSKEVVTNGAE